MADASIAPSSDHPTQQPVVKTPRYWPAVVLVGIYWAYHFLCRLFELDMLYLFVSRMAVTALVLLAFPLWWLTSRQLRRGDRWFALAVVILGLVAAGFLVVNPTQLPGLVMFGLPAAYTVATVWLLVARRASKATWRTGLAAAICLPLGFLTLLRWDGLTGDQHNELRWRWEPTAEQQFLAEHPPAKPASESFDEPLLIGAGDWPSFRGPNRDGVVRGSEIATDWQQRPPRLVWRTRVGPAWSSMTLVAGRLFTQEQRGEHEAVVCYAAATGDEIWAHEDACRFPEGVSGIGPRATPSFGEGRLYTLGATGTFNGLDAASGRKLWSHDLVADSGGTAPQPQSGFWGFSCSPLVAQGAVLVYGGGTGQEKLWAFDAETGEKRWSVDAGTNNYSSPQLANLNGRDQVLFLGQGGLLALEPASGEPLWQAPENIKAMNAMVQPHVVGSDELIVAADGGLRRLQLRPAGDSVEVTERWSKPARGLRPTFDDFVVHDGAIYGFDEGIFGCLDLETGKRTWKRGRYGYGQVLLLGDQNLLLVSAESGEVVLLQADPHQLREVGRFQAIEGKTWNHPIFAHDRLYVRNAEEMACYDLSTEERQAAN
ncbi:MAG TPA: PQQ-binding-like beta-propeller repeat protein [Pirellulales bacterium]|jgi:outer membrane protein assembly factor BamB|nr:PQQ-binding-like beta-propeller repeat protein [Pirellulales bacterium]